MTKHKTLVAASATAISAIALFTSPALAQALPMNPLAPPCGQYKFSGLTILNQSNGYRLEFAANGTTVNAPVTSYNNRQAVAGRGTVSGSINAREVVFTVAWDNRTFGDYSGSVNDSGKAKGETHGAGGSATWNFKNRLECL
ncbi:MAG TPA: hypothetical protein VHI10_05780 [Mycobacterium sp.]|nr:hypothetical protein [Mycobacterium sp.]